MATIYRFIVENKLDRELEGRKKQESISKKTTAKKGRAVSIFAGDKGGVEHNRKMRAINPLLNKATGGIYEKGMRVGRAGLGLIQVNSETGDFMGLSHIGIAILLSFAIQTILKVQRNQIEKANRQNTQNYKQLENGFDNIHGEFQLSRNYWNGRINFNENK